MHLCYVVARADIFIMFRVAILNQLYKCTLCACQCGLLAVVASEILLGDQYTTVEEYIFSSRTFPLID